MKVCNMPRVPVTRETHCFLKEESTKLGLKQWAFVDRMVNEYMRKMEI